MSATAPWLTTTELEQQHGIKVAKAKYHATKTLRRLGLAKKTHDSRRGQWLFSPEAVEYLSCDRRTKRGPKPLPTSDDTLLYIQCLWEDYKTVKGVASELGVAWYTAARWLDEMGLRQLTKGTMTNYVKRGKQDGC